MIPGTYSPHRVLALNVIRLSIADEDWAFLFDRRRQRDFVFWCEVAGADPEAVRNAAVQRRGLDA